MTPEMGWHASFRLAKFCGRCLTPAMIAAGQVRPFEVIEDEGNLPLFSGLSEMWERLIGGTPAGDPFDETNAHIAIGDDGRPTNQTMVDLIGTTTFRQPMDAGYPQHTDGLTSDADKIVFRATVADGDAEFSWAEVGIANAVTDGILLNRRPTAYGVKVAGQVWVISITLRFYGTESGSVQPPTGSPSGTLPGTCFCTPQPGGGAGTTDDTAQYMAATGDMTADHVVLQHVVRMPGTVKLIDILSDVASTVEWQVDRAGSALIGPVTMVSDVVNTFPVTGVEVNSGDILSFRLIAGGGANFSTCSIAIQERTNSNKQIVFADYNGGSTLLIGVKGQQIFRVPAGQSWVIHNADILALPGGGTGTDWIVRKNGVSIVTFSTGGSVFATQGALNVSASGGDIFEFEVSASDDVSSTMSLTVEKG